MQRRVWAVALSFLYCAVGIAAKPSGEPAAADAVIGPKQPAESQVVSSPDPWLVAEVSRLVEASLEALRDRREHRHQAFLKESLAKLPGFAPARWHSGYVQMGGQWVHVDQVPYLAGDNPALAKYAELREKLAAKRYPRLTTAQLAREYPLERKSSRHIVDDKTRSFRTTVTQSDRGGTIAIPATRHEREQTTMWAQADTYANERVRFTNTAGYSPGYARAQESLARWCGENGLSEEARVHWAHLLLQEPNNREAARALGLIEVGGRFVTRQQAAHAQQLARDAADSVAKWEVKLTKLSREAASPDEARRTNALGELRVIDDPNAVFALELVALWQSSPNRQRPEYAEAFDREVVALIAKFDSQPATESLVRFAILHDQDSVRHAAASALKNREPRAFVPLLLAGLTMPIEYGVQVVEDARGQKKFFAGASQEHDSHTAGMRETREVYNGWHLRLLTSAALERVSQLQRFNLQVENLNRRIVAALLRAVNIDPEGPFKDLRSLAENGSPNPKRWWEWWYDYNEQYTSGEKPHYGYDYDWSTTTQHDWGYDTNTNAHTVQDWYVRCISCFAKGTRVWTLSGPKAIEQVKVGDRVLAQRPETGELAYKGVLATTIRPPDEMLAIRAGKSTITTTLGHPFFVVGKGWRMAKELKDDDWVYAQGQTLPIDSIERAEPAEAYNLMVVDFGTYFVGKDRILVHDNSPIPPARLEMPGLLAASAAGR